MADQNRNPGSKQADGDRNSDSDNAGLKSKPVESDSMGGSGGRTGSGIGRSSSTDKSPSDKSDLSAGSKNQSEESIDEG